MTSWNRILSHYVRYISEQIERNSAVELFVPIYLEVGSGELDNRAATRATRQPYSTSSVYDSNFSNEFISGPFNIYVELYRA